jgi:ABC-type branched-subunit amino acid transport system ATPase component
MAKMPESNMKSLAIIGAAARLKQLDRERADILKMFPSLRLRTSASAMALGAPRRRPSAQARRAMSEGMRRFWARRKAAGKG